MPAFEAAVEAGAEWLEMDVHRTADGKLIVFHDSTTRRIAGEPGYIWRKDFARIRSLDAGAWFGQPFTGTRIPTLEEVFARIPSHIHLDIELKYASIRKQHAADVGSKLQALCERYERTGRILASSFSKQILTKIPRLAGAIEIGAIYHGSFSQSQVLREMERIGASWFIHNIRTMSASQLLKIKEAGHTTAVFTVNSERWVDHAVRCGVDYIITNEVEAVKEIIARKYGSDR
ncbi:MAG: hypothetical protein CL946_00850 [Ectothiorhodospiraceae bacterium]|nr:hypothetical protein [Ectothiorhodospiraceae bacterium]